MNLGNHRELEALITCILTQRGRCVSEQGLHTSYKFRSRKYALYLTQQHIQNESERTAVYHYSQLVYHLHHADATQIVDTKVVKEWKPLLPAFLQTHEQLHFPFSLNAPDAQP